MSARQKGMNQRAWGRAEGRRGRYEWVFFFSFFFLCADRRCHTADAFEVVSSTLGVRRVVRLRGLWSVTGARASVCPSDGVALCAHARKIVAYVRACVSGASTHPVAVAVGRYVCLLLLRRDGDKEDVGSER